MRKADLTLAMASAASSTGSGRAEGSTSPPNWLAGIGSSVRRTLPVVLLVGTLWVARYWRSAGFGLYEDDLTFIPRAIHMTLPQLSAFVVNYVVNLYGHARPLSDSFIHVFSNLGWRLGGLAGIYTVGFLIEAVNVVLFYLLLRRLRPLTGFALIGGLAYVLYSADTTQSFLTHSLGLQPSITLLLLALHAWLSQRRAMAYALAFVILFAYESPYPVFFAAPLLSFERDQHWPKAFLRHVVITGLLLALATGIKAVAGEERVAGMTMADAVLVPLNHMIVGPAVSLATFGLRPLEAVKDADPGVLMAALIAGGVFAWAMTLEDMGPSPELKESVTWIRSRTPWRWRKGLKNGSVESGAPPLALRLTLAGLAMWILAYPLTYTTLGHHIRGRPTRVHLAAVVGSSLVVASVGTAAIRAGRSSIQRRLRLVALAGWMGLLVGYGLVLQADYIRAWDLQKDFWTRLLPLVEDAAEGTVILVEPEGIEDTYQIAANTWNLPRVLDQLLVYPSSWKDPPRVYRLTPNWQAGVLGEGNVILLDATTTIAPPSLYGSFAADQVMLVATDASPWRRRLGPVAVSAGVIDLEMGPSGKSPVTDHGPLFDLMFPENAARHSLAPSWPVGVADGRNDGATRRDAHD